MNEAALTWPVYVITQQIIYAGRTDNIIKALELARKAVPTRDKRHWVSFSIHFDGVAKNFAWVVGLGKDYDRVKSYG